MYDRKRLALGTAVAYGVLALLVLSVLYTGTVLAYPVSGIGGFEVEAQNVTAQDFYLHPGVAETSSPGGGRDALPDEVESQPNYELFRGDYYVAGGFLSDDTCGDDTTNPGSTGNCMPLYNESNRVDAGYSGLVDDISQAGDTDEFAYRYTMNIDVQSTGTHTFYVDSDDGTRLYIDGNLVVDNQGFGDNTNVTGTYTFSTTGQHEIQVNYFEASGGQNLDVRWSGPTTGGSEVAVDNNLSYQTITNPDIRYYEADYSSTSPMPAYDSGNFVGYGYSANVDNINAGPRGQRVDNFSYQYRKCIEVPQDGDYTFYTTSDDGSRLSIDGTLVVNNDGLHGAQTQSGTINLEQGVHDISVDYFEAVNAETLDVEWEGPGFTREPLPDSVLSRTPCASADEAANYPDVVLELADVTFSNIVLTKDLDVSSLPGLTGSAQVRLNGGATFDTSRILFKASAVRAQGSTFRGFIVNESTGADARTRLVAASGPGSPAEPTRSLVDLNASAGDNGVEFDGVQIQAHYLAADEVPLAAVQLGVQYDPDDDGTYEYKFT